MKSNDYFNRPKGTVTMIMHKGGEFDLTTNSVVNGTEIARRQIKNLIVNEASRFMAARMAPGATNGKMHGSNYEPGRTDGEFESCGLKYLAVGVGILKDQTKPYDEQKNPVDTDNWDLQNPPAEKLTVTQLEGEYYRKLFTDWKFIDSTGNISEKATNVLLLSTTFLESEAVGPLTEMGLFGGVTATNTKNSGLMFNYKTFKVWNKENDARLTVVWRLTF